MSEEEKKYKLQPLNETAYNTEDLMAIVKVGWDLSESSDLRPEACIFRYYSPSAAADNVSNYRIGQPALVKVSRYSERGLWHVGAPEYAEHFAPLENGRGLGVHFGLVQPKAQNFEGVNDLHLLLLSAGKAPPELVYQIACRAWAVHHTYHRRGWSSGKEKCQFPDKYYLSDIKDAVAELTLRIDPQRDICDPGEILLPAEELAIKSLAINHKEVIFTAAHLSRIQSAAGSNQAQADYYHKVAADKRREAVQKGKDVKKAEREFELLIKKQEKTIEKEKKIRLMAANTWIKGGK